jgi:hypothetical protein
MKKYLLSLAVLTSTLFFTGCEKDKGRNVISVPVSTGAMVVCGGNVGGNIPSSLTYIDYKTGIATQNQFFANNHRELGQTANDALVYGEKMYIVVSGENTIEVVNLKTMKATQIRLVDLMGEKGHTPRCVTAGNGMIYVSTYGSSQADWAEGTTSGNGYVAAIDTLTFSLKATFVAGSFPEGVTVYDNYLIVANSAYSMGKKASISVIDMSTGKDEPVTDALITNPTKVAAAYDGIYFLDGGNYADVAAGVRKISRNSVSTLFDATFASFVGSNIYACNCPWGTTPTDFIVYNAESGTKTTYPSGVNRFFYPNVVTADPVTGHIFIGSYNENEDSGKPNYKSNGYVIEYSESGTKLEEYDCGVSPNAIVFNYEYQQIEY